MISQLHRRFNRYTAFLVCILLLFVGWNCPPKAAFAQEPDARAVTNPSSAQASEDAEQGNMPDEENSAKPPEKKDEKKEEKKEGLLTNNAVIFGILMIILGFVFWSSNCEIAAFKLFYRFVPMLLMCYFLPALVTAFGLVGEKNADELYKVATRYLLPACLLLLTLSIDLKEIFKLGPKALIMFLTGTAGVVLGGPLAVLLVSFIAPDIIGVDGPTAVWRGLSTVAGSWIGGGANQAAMQLVFMAPPAGASDAVVKELGDLYSVMLAVDIFVAEAWMVFLLLGVGKAKEIDRFFRADSSAIENLKAKMEQFSATVARVPTSKDLMLIAAIGFGATGISHLIGEQIAGVVNNIIESNPVEGFEGDKVTAVDSQYGYLKNLGVASPFFWLIVLSTTIGVGLSFTKLRKLEGAGASKLGTVFIFTLVGVIGLKMNIWAVFDYPGFFLVGGIWMAFHVALLFLVGWLIRAPYFFLAVGSKANIGGAASAPVVAAAFHPALAPVGVLLAVLGYALGTYGAMICSWMMQAATPG